jgi:hypothetical protein
MTGHCEPLRSNDELIQGSRMLGRRFLLGLGTLAILGKTASPAHADTETNLRRFIKMRGALDGRLVIGCVTGRYSGVVDGQEVPLFGVVSAVFSLYRRRGDGFEVASLEQAYYTDLQSGQALKNWKNIYTGESVSVPVYSEQPSLVFVGPDLVFHTPNAPGPGVRVEHTARGPQTVGGDIVFVEQVAVSVAASKGGPPFTYRDNTVLRAAASAVDRADTQATPSQTTFDAVVSWRPWLNMGARPGHMEALGYGGFGVSPQNLPAAWVSATKQARPSLLDHPERVVEKAWHGAK